MKGYGKEKGQKNEKREGEKEKNRKKINTSNKYQNFKEQLP